MGNIKLGLNLEFARFENGSFTWAMDKAAEIGYGYVEPMVHWGRELLSEAGYFHSFSMLNDPLILAEVAASRGLKISSLSSHAPLAKPEVSVEYQREVLVRADQFLIWADGEDTKVTYLSPQVLAARHGLDPDLAANLAGIDPLTDALVAG